MRAALSALFALAFYLGTAVAVLLAFPAAAIGGGALPAVIHGWARWHRGCAALLLGIGVCAGSEAGFVAGQAASSFVTVEA